ncbi:MAG: mevalonate kinase [Promethearchaeota archaeon]
MSLNEVKVSAPGRICLFGEHQDYLGLPVISAAISLFINIKALKTNDRNLTINLLDLNQQRIIPLTNREVHYQYSRDYLCSSYNLFIRKGYRLNQGYHCKVQGNIPINAGVASSSALVIAWITFLAKIFKAQLTLTQIAELGYQAEVGEFHESGGRMDHYTTTLGKILYITSKPPFKYERLNVPLKGLVLGDSLEPKDTVADLTQIKKQIQIGISRLCCYYKKFNLQTTSIQDISKYLSLLPTEIANCITATLVNRDLTQKAKKLLTSNNFSSKAFYTLLDLHHMQLAQNLRISTPKIEKLIIAAKDAGALGCKINGSGFGGSMIAYAPECTEDVGKAIEKAGGKSYNLSICEGVQVYKS